MNVLIYLNKIIIIVKTNHFKHFFNLYNGLIFWCLASYCSIINPILINQPNLLSGEI